MADKAAEPAEPTESTESAEATEPADQGDDDVRRRFREALERKKKATHLSSEHHDAGGKGVGHSQVLSGRRQFRRKSG